MFITPRYQSSPRMLRLIVLASLLCVAPQDVSGQPAENDVRVAARWHMRYTRRIHNPESVAGPPLVKSSPYETKNDVVLVAREEVLTDSPDIRRFIIEDVSYQYSQGAVTATPHDEPPFLSEAPIHASFHFSTADFNQPLLPEQQQSLAEQRRTIERLRREVATAERRRRQSSDNDEMRNLRTELLAAKQGLRISEFLNASHEQRFSAGHNEQEAWASAGICLPALKYTRVWWEGRQTPPPGVAEFRFIGNANRRSEELSHGLECSFSARGTPGRPLISKAHHNSGNDYSQRERTVFVRVPADLPPEQDYRLLVELQGYDTWTPGATPDQDVPGNHIRVRARVVTRDQAAPADAVVKRLSFELINTSAEPGVAMNYPPADKARRDPDLQFDRAENSNGPTSIVDDRGQIAEAEGASRADAVISSFDWGASGYLLVMAELNDGRVLFGHLADARHRTYIPLPKRQEGSRIADYWKERYGLSGVPDESDGENNPVGDNTVGDGLTLYEEYRGFYEDRRHIRGHTGKKDIFIRDEIGGPGTRQGIAVFATASGLEVHYKLRKDEIGDDPQGCDHHGQSTCGRLVNFNHQSAHLVDQHGLRITKSDPGFLGGQVVGDGPGTPKEIEKIEIHPKIASFFRGWSYASVLAHELCHSVGVWHHGEDDIGMVLWRAEDIRGALGISEYKLDDNGDPIVNTRRSVRVYHHGEEVPANHRNFLRGRGYKVWVAVKHGQHSGDSRCLMRYDCAQAMEDGIHATTGRRRRVLLLNQTEPAIGTYLCTSPAGGTRLGDADSNPEDGPNPRGTCEKQIRVNDF